MKKILLFLLFTVSLQAQTYSSISDLIDNNLASSSKITAVKHREVEHALLDYIQNNLFQSGDIKVIKCDATYLSNNFEADGLGKNLRLGWAICNGNNGTVNLIGKVPIHYSSDFPLGTTGGNKDAVVVAHSHSMTYGSSGVNTSVQVSRDADGNTLIGTTSTNSTGVDGTNKNMQPYQSMVYIMKL